MESISEVNFPQNERDSSINPLNFVIDNWGSVAAVDDLHSSVAWVAAFCCSRFFSNFAFCSEISLSRTPSAVNNSPTLFPLALPYLSLGLRIELFLVLGRPSRGAFRFF